MYLLQNYLIRFKIMIDIILSIVAAIAVLFAAKAYFTSKENTNTEGTKVVSTAIDGTIENASKNYLPKSVNQTEGLTFAYTCWLKIDNFSYKYGQQKVIFTKGPVDLSAMCPGVFLDGNTNTILVKIDTFGSQEIIPVSNIPAKKWIHFGLVVDQNSIDVYINGLAHTHRTIVQLPKQNSETVHTGIDGGFEGKIANLVYYNYFMTPAQIKALSLSPPQNEDIANFDYRWWSTKSA
jgi:hypothetical protein